MFTRNIPVEMLGSIEMQYLTASYVEPGSGKAKEILKELERCLLIEDTTEPINSIAEYNKKVADKAQQEYAYQASKNMALDDIHFGKGAR